MISPLGQWECICTECEGIPSVEPNEAMPLSLTFMKLSESINNMTQIMYMCMNLYLILGTPSPAGIYALHASGMVWAFQCTGLG